MGGFLDKLGVYDFLNLIGAGGVFVCGTHAIGFIKMKDIFDYINTGNSVLDVALFIGICFIIGTLLQQLGSLICKRNYKNELLDKLLADDSTAVTNPLSRTAHRERLDALTSTQNNETIENRYHYYFSYCEYTINVHGKDDKAERMRNLRGLTSALMACFSVLAVFAALGGGVTLLRVCMASANACGSITNAAIGASSEWNNVARMLICCGVFVGMACFNTRSYRLNTQFWIRMVLDVYCACTDNQNKYIVSNDN